MVTKTIVTKKIMFGLILSAVLWISLMLAGCVDYKAYKPQPEADPGLVNEIAAVEEELGLTQESPAEETAEGETAEEDEAEAGEGTETEEEIILPNLGEGIEEEVIVEESLPVISAKEKELVKLNLKVSDPDQEVVTYTFSPPLDAKGQWQTNYGDAGEYIITITATDGTHTTEKRVKLVIEKQNVPPIIEEIRDVFASEGDLITLEPKASDPNRDQVTVTISEPLSSGSFQTDHNSAGEYQIKVLASDGELETEKIVRMTIKNVNMLPEVGGLADITIKEGETARISPTVSDLDGDDIKVTISEPVGNDGVWETGYTDHGEYEIKVVVTDGKDTVTEKVRLVVEDVNMAPEITDIFLG